MYSDNNEIEGKDDENKDVNIINSENENIIQNEINDEIKINDINNNTENKNEIKNEFDTEIKKKEIKINQSLIISNDIAESVVSIILDKIISNIIIKKKIQKIYSNLPEYCYNYIHKLTSIYLKNNFVFHENGIDNLSYQKNILFYNKNPINKVNNWNIINEPSVPELDRNITGRNKLIKLSKKEEINLISNEGKNENEISDINSIQFTSKDEIEENNSIKFNEKNDINNNINKRKKYKIKRSFGEIVREKKLKEKQFNKRINNNEEENDDDDNYVLEMTSHDLKNVDNTYKFYNDNDENDLLRKERELLIIKKEKEKIKEEKRKKKEKKLKLKFYNIKNFESNKLTFDPNGKIIKKNLTNLNNIKKDLPKPKLKIKEKSTNILSEEKKRIILNPIKEKNKSKKENIIFNPNDKPKLFDFENPKKKNVNKEIDISGNNFRLVKPEIGVIISNENNKQKKEGGFEYIKKYNKPSMNEYNQKLSYNSQNSNNLFSSYISLDNNSENINNDMDENNYIGYKEEFNDNNNPLFQDGYKMSSLNSSRNKFQDMNIDNNNNINININNLNILKNKKSFLKIEKKKNKNNLIHSYDSIKMHSNRYKNYNTIQLNENIKNNNLKSIFIENDENKPNIKYNSIEKDSYSYLRKKEYFLNGNNHYKKRRELPIITENNGNKNILDEYVDINKINKFNFRIIKDKKWGDDIHSNPLFPNNNNNNKLIKSENYLQTDDNRNIFRKSNLSNRIKETGNNIINNIRIREKNKKIKIF